MNSFMGFSMGEANREKKLMVFDWDKAAQIIKERKPEIANAGLCYNWEYTGGCIYENGKPFLDDNTYLASTWAVPELQIDDCKVIPCYKMKSETPKWDASTKWPKSALEILNF